MDDRLPGGVNVPGRPFAPGYPITRSAIGLLRNR
jgi:hypothetical protein